MTDLSTASVHNRTITAFFDTREAADKAVADIEAMGIPSQHISRMDGSASSSATYDQSDKTFWDSLKDVFMPDEDRYGYAEGLRRGGHIVTVKTEEANYTRAIDILDRDGAIDMDEREASWRKEGWTGYQAGSSYASTTAAPATSTSAMDTAELAAPRAQAATAAVGERSLKTGEDEVIPVYEERLNVGKRDVSHGRVRLRSYVVETPVEEQVALRSERVEIDRRPVDRAITGTEAVFQDRVIEAEERAEEAVIAKDLRVKEEISLRKVGEERTQTVSDTVRRTEVELDDDRAHAVAGSTRVAEETLETDPIRKDVRP